MITLLIKTRVSIKHNNRNRNLIGVFRENPQIVMTCLIKTRVSIKHKNNKNKFFQNEIILREGNLQKIIMNNK